MSALKKIITFLSLLVLVTGAFGFSLRGELTETVSVLNTGWGTQPYLRAAAGEDGLACAARWEPSGEFSLCFFDLQGTMRDQWDVRLPDTVRNGELCALYPADHATAFLGFYDENAEMLYLYRVGRGQAPELIMREECVGATSVERREAVRLGAFSKRLGQVSFALLSGNSVKSFTSRNGGSGIEQLAMDPRGDAASAAVLPDGQLALGGWDSLTLAGRRIDAPFNGQEVEMLACTGSGLYYLDGASLTEYYADLTGASVQETLSLGQVLEGRRLDSLALVPEGGALLLLDGHTLLAAQGSSVRDLTDMLYTTSSAGIARLLGIFAGAVALTALLWFLFTGRGSGKMPLALHWTLALCALTLVCGVAMEYSLMRPASERALLEQRTSIVSGIAGSTLSERTADQDELVQRLSMAMDGAKMQNVRSVNVVSAHLADDGWFTAGGVRAELSEGFYGALAEQALERGSAAQQSGGRFWYCTTAAGNWVVTVALDGEAASTPQQLRNGILTALALIAAAAILILFIVNGDVRRLALGVQRYAAEEEWRDLRIRSLDEVEGIADTINGMAKNRALELYERRELIESYRRFVPERVLSLLGESSILDVDKSTFSSRRMAVMKIWFVFPEPVYTNAANSRLLFDSINQIIERTAPIATQKGGTVFNFAYNGYDVVMEQDAAQVISSAVAVRQEVLAVNELRAQKGLPTVTLRIALDVGDVMLGLVGDSTQMEPTTISSSFSTVRELIGICNRLEANILCTESIISGAEGYGSRYMGKCSVGGNAVRVYEVFDGDPYDARRQKASTVRRFSQGVLSLYSGDTAQAKRVFLELAHDTPGDGGARYYLYLADRVEQNEEVPCELNGGESA